MDALSICFPCFFSKPSLTRNGDYDKFEDADDSSSNDGGVYSYEEDGEEYSDDLHNNSGGSRSITRGEGVASSSDHGSSSFSDVRRRSPKSDSAKKKKKLSTVEDDKVRQRGREGAMLCVGRKEEENVTDAVCYDIRALRALVLRYGCSKCGE